jgi:hypothetical protein
VRKLDYRRSQNRRHSGINSVATLSHKILRPASTDKGLPPATHASFPTDYRAKSVSVRVWQRAGKISPQTKKQKQTANKGRRMKLTSQETEFPKYELLHSDADSGLEST